MEKTLGTTMLYIYLHVSLVWAGTSAIVTMAIFGLISAIQPKLHINLIRNLGWLAMIFYSIGLLISGLAAWLAWGRVFWSEPIYAASAKILVFILLIQILSLVLNKSRWLGLIYLTPAVYMVKMMFTLPKVMHPDNPIGSSMSWSIRLTFYALTVIFCLFIIWLSTRFQQKQQ